MRYFPLWLAVAAMVIAAVSSFALDFEGRVSPGTVTLKREHVRISEGSWSREFLLRVVYHPAGLPRAPIAELSVNEDEFDRLHIGDEAPVRHLPVPLISGARLASRNTFSLVRDFVSRPDAWKYFAVAALAATTGLFLLRPWLLLELFICASALLFALAVTLPRPDPAPSGHTLVAEAQVIQSVLVDELWSTPESHGVSAAPAFQIVQVSFTPEGRRDPVTAVDVIDALPARVSIEYDPAAPRHARIRGASRTYAARNYFGFEYLVSLAFAAAVLATILEFARRFRRGRKR